MREKHEFDSYGDTISLERVPGRKLPIAQIQRRGSAEWGDLELKRIPRAPLILEVLRLKERQAFWARLSDSYDDQATKLRSQRDALYATVQKLDQQVADLRGKPNPYAPRAQHCGAPICAACRTTLPTLDELRANSVPCANIEDAVSCDAPAETFAVIRFVGKIVGVSADRDVGIHVPLAEAEWDLGKLIPCWELVCRSIPSFEMAQSIARALSSRPFSDVE